jgi:two-component sensor histidine kinase
MTVYDLDPTYSRERADAVRERATRTGDFTFETVRRRKDGTIIPIEITVTYLEYEGERYSFSFARDISARLKHEAALKASIEEKEVLLKEIHHRVKNNLSVIASLLNLQRDRIDSQEEAIAALEKSRDRISTMADIHMLLYEAESFSAVEFSQYAKTLTEKLVNVYGRAAEVSLELALRPLRLDITRAIPLALILNELVTNALKHAFSDRHSGRLGVELSLDTGGLVRLSVWDDGPGLTDKAALSGVTSLGMELVRVLVDQLHGSLQLSKGPGARIEVVFPPT